VLAADQIIVLEAGRIAAQGTHDSLLRDSTLYQDIYRSQFGEDALDAVLAGRDTLRSAGD
jgi:ATP-binding cassette subfamily B protein